MYDCFSEYKAILQMLQQQFSSSKSDSDTELRLSSSRESKSIIAKT